VVVDGLGGGEDGVLGVGDALDRAVAVVVHVGHGVGLFLVLSKRDGVGVGIDVFPAPESLRPRCANRPLDLLLKCFFVCFGHSRLRELAAAWKFGK